MKQQKAKQYKTLRLILGDQLNHQHSWFEEPSGDTLYLMAELHQETNYVRHHIQKVCAFFTAMKAFANHLASLGHDVVYLDLDDTKAFDDLTDLVTVMCRERGIERFEYQQPDEYRLCEQLAALKLPDIAIEKFETEHFYLRHGDLTRYFKPATSHKMELFYRKMRKEQNVLMSGDKPVKDKWNFDHDNRNRLKPEDLAAIPEPLLFSHSVKAVLERLQRHNIETIGQAEASLTWPISRAESLQLLEYFCEVQLPAFGTFQDAMTDQSKHSWSLYHSRLSFSLNAKLISPREVVDAAVDAYQSSNSIDIAQVEGFVRQILGWREYVRGIYWINMPDYASYNRFKADKNLPEFYWDAKTKMNCMANCIDQSLQYAYAHHIQRLMVTGTFCLLAGIDPDQVDEWYLGIYIDALEWVEMPNTRGMSQAADNGIMATKPYAASGNYINKMSDYCKGCYYKVKEKTGERACPFNSLYWHFMHKHRAELEKNPRIGMVYRNWDKNSQQEQKLVLDRAQWCLDNINQL
ncbi:MAG: cryptochrome/photolyase family protein [Pseudomonadales bacterium]